MTVVIGILNKRGVAIAADSAVTIGNGKHHKIFNDAEKLFELSKSHPVGILFYNSANFMMTPWEPIVKSYRNQLGSKNFSKLEEYVNDFIDYLKKSYDSLADVDTQKIIAQDFINFVISSIISDARNGFGVQLSIDKPDEFNVYLDSFITNQISDFFDPDSIATGFNGYEITNFKTDYSELVKSIYIAHCNETKLKSTPEILNNFIQLIYNCLISENFMESYTGLVFAGYGTSEIYPSLHAIEISGVFSNRLKYRIKDVTKISNSNCTAAIRPFGQTDVIDTILHGVHPLLENVFIDTTDIYLSIYRRKIEEILKKEKIEIPEEILNFETEPFVERYKELTSRTKREKFIVPLMNTIDYLSKQDLAEMAESLIYLTYLKRRITNDEESVGGPVDVAVLSKGDGFIWMKKKNYFKPELNQHNNNI